MFVSEQGGRASLLTPSFSASGAIENKEKGEDAEREELDRN